MSAILFTQHTDGPSSPLTNELQLNEQILKTDPCSGDSKQQSHSANDELVTVSPQTPTSSVLNNPTADRSVIDSVSFSAPVNIHFHSNCTAILKSQMAALELNNGGSSTVENDSGLDTTTIKPATTLPVMSDDNNKCMMRSIEYQRALSSNSGGYASSTGGPDDGVKSTTEQTIDMSAICGLEEASAESTSFAIINVDPASTMTQNYEIYSENVSESSSMLGGIPVTAVETTTAATAAMETPIRRANSVKSKMGVLELGRRGFGTPMSRSLRDRDCSRNTPVATTPAQGSCTSTPRVRAIGIKRTSSLSRHLPATSATVHRQSDRQSSLAHASINASMPAATQAMSMRSMSARTTKPHKPDSLPNSLSRTQSMSMQRLVQRTPSLSRARTPCTPSEDGRWPGNARIASPSVGVARRGVSVMPDLMSLKMRSSNMMASVEVKPGSSNASASTNPYSTLPRRRKQKSVEDLTTANELRSSSITRDARMTGSVMANTRRSLVSDFGVSTPQGTHSRFLMLARKMPAPAPTSTPTPKTRIYHETGSQTAITNDDLERAFAGRAAAMRAIDAVDQNEQMTQTDMRDVELERLRDEVRQLAQREHELTAKLHHEREEKLATQRELHLNMERVMSMLEMARIAGRRFGRSGGTGGTIGSVSGISLDGDATTPTSDEGSGHDSLQMLESQIQMSGHELIERQHEIGQLRQLCRTLQLEMARSLAAQECLLQEKAAIEQESGELQDFLQHEKSALCDALKELESEHEICKQQLVEREEEVKVLRDECRHLVRLNEQRRQENRMLQSKYAALENKSKEMMMQQNYSVSGASAALSGLNSRLDSLAEQLVSTYNITDHDLEDIGFQPEAQHTHNNTIDDRTSQSGDEYPGRLPTCSNVTGLELCTSSRKLLPHPSDGSLSPQRNQSFIAAVISAIRNATTPSSKKLLTRNGKRICMNSVGGESESNGHNSNKTIGNYTKNCNNEAQNAGEGDSDSTEMLDSETEPCLMMDNVLEDVTMPDSHSHNMVSSCTGIISQIEIPSEIVNSAATGEESLHNLSQAIVNRQQMELQISAMQRTTPKASLQLNKCDHDNSGEDSCHDSLAEMPSLMEYCTAQAVVDQVIEVDCLVTKLLKVLRLIQMDNDNCIQQLIVDKNKLQENKEDMLEKLKDLQDVNIKLQDDLMDATQELILKNNDLSNTKAEMQRHRNEIDKILCRGNDGSLASLAVRDNGFSIYVFSSQRLTQDICNLSTLCSNYKKLSPTIEFSPLQQQLPSPTNQIPPAQQRSLNAKISEAGDVPIGGSAVEESDAEGILSLLKMWKIEGQFKQAKIRSFPSEAIKSEMGSSQLNECLRVDTNQLENILFILQTNEESALNFDDLQKLRRDIEIVKANANWANIIRSDHIEGNCNSAKITAANCFHGNEDVNANESIEESEAPPMEAIEPAGEVN